MVLSSSEAEPYRRDATIGLYRLFRPLCNSSSGFVPAFDPPTMWPKSNAETGPSHVFQWQQMTQASGRPHSISRATVRREDALPKPTTCCRPQDPPTHSTGRSLHRHATMEHCNDRTAALTERRHCGFHVQPPDASLRSNAWFCRLPWRHCTARMRPLDCIACSDDTANRVLDFASGFVPRTISPKSNAEAGPSHVFQWQQVVRASGRPHSISLATVRREDALPKPTTCCRPQYLPTHSTGRSLHRHATIEHRNDRTVAITSPRREIFHFKTPHFAAEVHRLVLPASIDIGDHRF
ncbi:hypothetical protein Pla52n_70720 [Stieleria varia]|uniref:Uncharacterized protein n=1 Tax=Stieleria varia TaxID=2528005 RepID=A0A5C5ZHX9_9BACT|nr:hypothetical protein Pla52n_70720 [Stieleria varia]